MLFKKKVKIIQSYTEEFTFCTKYSFTKVHVKLCVLLSAQIVIFNIFKGKANIVVYVVLEEWSHASS